MKKKFLVDISTLDPKPEFIEVFGLDDNPCNHCLKAPMCEVREPSDNAPEPEIDDEELERGLLEFMRSGQYLEYMEECIWQDEYKYLTDEEYKNVMDKIAMENDSFNTKSGWRLIHALED